MDLLCSLEESIRGDWNADVDVHDGKLQLLRSEYTARIEGVPTINESLSSRHFEDLLLRVMLSWFVNVRG